MTIREQQIERILDHYENPRHRGRLAEADLVGDSRNPGCGDVIRLYVKLDGGERIAAIAFECEGCTISRASASMFTEKVLGQTLDEAARLEPEFLLDDLGAEVLASRPKCVTLALDALKSAHAAYRTLVHEGHPQPQVLSDPN